MSSGNIRGETAEALSDMAARAAEIPLSDPSYHHLWVPYEGALVETYNPVEIDWLSLNREFS